MKVEKIQLDKNGEAFFVKVVDIDGEAYGIQTAFGIIEINKETAKKIVKLIED